MQPSSPASNLPVIKSVVPPNVGRARLLIGLLQGALLYWLYRAARDHGWPATVPTVFEALVLMLVLTPVILVSSLGHMSARRAAQWVLTSAAISVALGAYDAWRHAIVYVAGAGKAAAHLAQTPSFALSFCVAVGFCIAHSMMMAGASERRRIATYAAYFEAAWKLAVQLSFSALFVGVVWLVLLLGAKLFMLIKLSFLHDMMEEAWFVIPVIAFAFTWAMHITDVRPAIVRGIRSLLLVLMSWILPVSTLIVGGFLASLLFTGLAPLWATKLAGGVLLGAAGLLVVMINAAWQNGAAASTVAPVIRWSARVAALLLAPVTGIAMYALGLRVAEHGWTDDRIIAAACLLVAACYAAGYAVAALRKGWLEAVAAVNIATAFVVLAVLLALFSPLADPARLSVNHQLARLAAGKVTAAKFDNSYLRFEGARFGRAALAQLSANAAGPDAAAIRQGVEHAMAQSRPWVRGAGEAKVLPADLAVNLTVWPGSAHLPVSFSNSKWSSESAVPGCLWKAGSACDAYLLDLSGDGKPEVIVIGTVRGGGAVVMGEDAQGKWRAIEMLPSQFAGCASVRKNLVEGRFRAVAPVGNVLEIDGKRIWSSPMDETKRDRCAD